MPEAAILPAGPKVRAWARQHGFSDWMVARFVHVFEAAGMDKAHTLRFLDGLGRRPPRYLRANPLRTTADELAKRLAARGFKLQATAFDANVLQVRHAPISPGATIEHLLGLSTPQDLASAAAGLALGAGPGDTVADLAAAPGIKTLHVAGGMEDDGAIVAVEPDQARFRALRANLERGGASCVALRCERGQDVPGEGWADRVLLDAPCTGEGTLPKDRSRRRGRMEEVARLSAVQAELVDAADRILRPGGTLVYTTCTFAPEENEAQTQRLVDRGYRIEALPFDACEGAALGRGVTTWPGLELAEEMDHARRFFPGIHPTLGFFVVRLRKGDA